MSVIDEQLFRAILAVDSHNRGDLKGPNISEIVIGAATIVNVQTLGAWRPAGGLLLQRPARRFA